MRKSIAIVITTILFLSNLAPAMAISIGNNIEYIPDPRNLGIGTIDPQAKLVVNGDAMIRGSLSIIDGTEGAGKVLTSDQFGKATWTNIATTTSGLDFSNFLAAMTLDENTTITLAGLDLNFGPDLLVLNGSTGNIGIGTNDPQTALQVGAPAAGAAINLAGSDGVYIANNLEVDGKIYGDGSEITSLNPTNFSGPITAESATTANAAKTLVSPDGSITVATTTDAGGIDFTLADSFVVTNSEDETIFQVKNAAGNDLLTVNHDKVLMGGLSLTGPLTGTTIGANLISITPGPNNGFVGNGSRLTNLEAGDIVGAITAAKTLVRPDGTSLVTTTDLGNVGIGVADPTDAKLEVAGEVKATGFTGSGANLEGIPTSAIPGLADFEVDSANEAEYLKSADGTTSVRALAGGNLSFNQKTTFSSGLGFDFYTGNNAFEITTGNPTNDPIFKVKDSSVVVGSDTSGNPDSPALFNIGARTFESSTAASTFYKTAQFSATTITVPVASATVITGAATVHIAGAPIAGPDVTITNAYALKVDGDTQITGELSFGADSSIDTTGLDLSGFTAGGLADDVTITRTTLVDPTLKGQVNFAADAVLNFDDATVINDFTVTGDIASDTIHAGIITAGTEPGMGFDGDGSLLTNVNAEILVGPGGSVIVATTDDDGRLGVATPVPTDTLEVTSSGTAGNTGITITGVDTGGAPMLTLNNPDNEKVSVLTARDGDAFSFEYDKGTSADERLVAIRPDGKMGIGTFGNNIDQKLVVAGNVKASIYYGDGSKLVGVLATGFVENTTLPGLVVSDILSANHINAQSVTLLNDPLAPAGTVQGFVGNGSLITNINPANIDGAVPNAVTAKRLISPSDATTVVSVESGNNGSNVVAEIPDPTGWSQIRTDARNPAGANTKKWAFGSTGDTRPNTNGGPNSFYVFQYTDKNDAIVADYRMIIKDDGNVGVGTHSPEAKLHVAGTTLSDVFYLKKQITVNATPTTTINWNNANRQILILDEDTTLLFTEPPVSQVGSLVLEIIQTGGGNAILDFDSLTRWPGGFCPPVSTVAGSIDVLTCLWDGTNYLCQFSKDFKPKGTI